MVDQYLPGRATISPHEPPQFELRSKAAGGMRGWRFVSASHPFPSSLAGEQAKLSDAHFQR